MYLIRLLESCGSLVFFLRAPGKLAAQASFSEGFVARIRESSKLSVKINGGLMTYITVLMIMFYRKLKQSYFFTFLLWVVMICESNVANVPYGSARPKIFSRQFLRTRKSQ